MGTVKVEEALSIRVGKFIVPKGFSVADNTGEAISSLAERNSFGILKDQEMRPRKAFFGLITITEKSRRPFIGIIFFDDERRKATEKNWVFEIYGQQHLDSAKKLSEEMASTFDVAINIRLVNNEPNLESYPGDWYDGF